MSQQSLKNPIIKIFTIAFTLSLGYLGANLAQFVQLPVPALLGSGLLLSILAFTRLPLSMPLLMRNAGFTILGCSMGSSITSEMLTNISQWPLSLLGLALTVLTMMFLSTWVLSRYFQQTKHTALLASTPGALSTVVALASDGKGDLSTVVVLQSLRLILVMLSFPLIIHSLGLQGTVHIDVIQQSSLAGTTVAALLLTAFALALVLEKLKLPAAYILSGLILSGTGHVSGWLTGNLPSQLVTLGFVIIGCVVGTRLKGMKLSELRSLALAAVISVLLSSLVAALGAAIIAKVLALPFGQVWIAYAPGGIEAMAALALALHYDPAYIAAHHLSRIVAITLLMPVIARFLQEKGEHS